MAKSNTTTVTLLPTLLRSAAPTQLALDYMRAESQFWAAKSNLDNARQAIANIAKGIQPITSKTVAMNCLGQVIPGLEVK
jgi:hypothetical protein